MHAKATYTLLCSPGLALNTRFLFTGSGRRFLPYYQVKSDFPAPTQQLHLFPPMRHNAQCGAVLLNLPGCVHMSAMRCAQYFPGQACSRVNARASCSYFAGSSLKSAANSGSAGWSKFGYASRLHTESTSALMLNAGLHSLVKNSSDTLPPTRSMFGWQIGVTKRTVEGRNG